MAEAVESLGGSLEVRSAAGMGDDDLGQRYQLGGRLSSRGRIDCPRDATDPFLAAAGEIPRRDLPPNMAETSGGSHVAPAQGAARQRAGANSLRRDGRARSHTRPLLGRK